jgi:hypothetical protein
MLAWPQVGDAAGEEAQPGGFIADIRSGRKARRGRHAE